MLLFIGSESTLRECFCDIINTDHVREINVSSRKNGTLVVAVTYIHKTNEEAEAEAEAFKEYMLIAKEDKFYFLEQLKNLGFR